MEDRIHAAGKGEELEKAIDAFKASKKARADEQILYDDLTALGADPEEADAFVELMLED